MAQHSNHFGSLKVGDAVTATTFHGFTIRGKIVGIILSTDKASANIRVEGSKGGKTMMFSDSRVRILPIEELS